MYTFLIVLHIIAGTLALIAGPVAMIAAKRRGLHTLSGNVYAYSMYAVGATTLALFFLAPERLLMLFLIGVFSIHLTYTGVRSIAYRLPKAQASRMDYWVSAIVGLSGAAMVIWGSTFFFRENGQFAAILLTVFGAICLNNVRLDFQYYRQLKTGDLPSKKHWLLFHISRMGGSYIATFTAFAVNNIFFLPQLAVWLLPSAIGTVLIIYVRRRERKGSFSAPKQ